MIFEGSCETEDWGNGCWKSSFASQEEITFSNIENIFFNQINADFFQKRIFMFKCTFIV